MYLVHKCNLLIIINLPIKPHLFTRNYIKQMWYNYILKGNWIELAKSMKRFKCFMLRGPDEHLTDPLHGWNIANTA